MKYVKIVLRILILPIWPILFVIGGLWLLLTLNFIGCVALVTWIFTGASKKLDDRIGTVILDFIFDFPSKI